MIGPVIAPLLSQSFKYEIDANVSLVGSHPTGIIIPKKALIHTAEIKVITAVFDGGAGASFNIGWVGNLGAIYTGGGLPLAVGSTGIISPTVVSLGLPVLVTVLNFPLTTGKFICCISYYNLFE